MARVIYWHRTDLRLHDSPALQAALDLKPEAFWPVWCWDPHYVFRVRVGPNRFQFLIDCQNDLTESYTKLNKRQKLHLIREAPQTLFPKLFKAWKISHLVFEKDADGYGKTRDEQILKIAKEAGVEVITKYGRTLWDSDEIVKQNGGKPTMSITQLQAAGQKIGEVPRPIKAPTSIPDPGETKLDFDHEAPSDNPDVNSKFRTEKDKSYTKLAGPNGDFAPPTLEELGMPKATTPHRGGETRGLEALDKITSDKDYTAQFQKPMTSPAAFEPQSTTLLSPHMHFGSVSVREFYWRVQDIVKKHKSPSTPPASLTGQLLFRDMYFGCMAALGHKMTQTYDNPVIRFIPWHLPSKIDAKTKLITHEYEVDSPEANLWFKRWRSGRTGFPWIDAIMRQLRQEGWIHHLARHSVACFLTRGGCYIDWERGAEVFEEFLIDHEAACNSGNWQWLSCTAFFAQFYRCYSPIAFGQKWDKEGEYIRQYVPELAKFDKKYIFEPWKAPIADQKKWGCLIKGDGGAEEGKLDEDIPKQEGQAVYPKPMFDFSQRRQVCIDGVKNGYDVGLRGADKAVLDGTWRKQFDDSAEGPTKGSKGPPGAQMEDDNHAMGEYEENGHDEEQKSPRGQKHKRETSQGSMDKHVKKTKK